MRLLPSCNCLTGIAGEQCERCQTGYFGATCDLCPGAATYQQHAASLTRAASPAAAGAGAPATTGSPGERTCFAGFSGESCTRACVPRVPSRTPRKSGVFYEGLLRAVCEGRVPGRRPVRQVPVAQHDDGGGRDGLLHAAPAPSSRRSRSTTAATARTRCAATTRPRSRPSAKTRTTRRASTSAAFPASAEWTAIIQQTTRCGAS